MTLDDVTKSFAKMLVSISQRITHSPISNAGWDLLFFLVTSCFGFPNQFALIAMDYFDRVLSRRNSLPTAKSEIQLLALSCFYLAVKLFQAGPILSTEQICMISGFIFAPTQIVATEQKILRELDWCLYPPTALEFLEPYLQILQCCSNIPLQYYAIEIMEAAEEYVNEMTLDYYFIANRFMPSHVALAAVVNAIFSIVPNHDNTTTIHDITRTLSQICAYKIDEQDVILCCERLLRLMNVSHDNNLDEMMSNPYHTLRAIPNDSYHANSISPNSPVAVTSYATDFSCQTYSDHFVSTYRSMPPITSNNNRDYIAFTRDYS
jgi:hypothetical protein